MPPCTRSLQQTHNFTMTIHGDVQKTKESKDFVPAGLIRRGHIHFPKQSPHYSFESRALARDSTAQDSTAQDSKETKMDASESCAAAQDSKAQAVDSIAVIMSLMTYLNSAFPAYFRNESKDYWKKNNQHARKTEQDDDDMDDTKEAAVFTLDEIYARLAKKIETMFSYTERIAVYVIAADKKKYVPKEKERAQKKRKSDPYPSGSSLSDNGILVNGQECMINVQRMMQTRSLRESFFMALMTRLQQDERMSDFCIIADVQNDGAPFRMYQGQTTFMHAQNWHVGEDDIRMPMWAVFFGSTHQILIQSCDRDLDVILALNHRKIPKYLVLDFEDGRHEAIHEMVEALEKEGWTVEMYAAAACLGGTDYVEKKTLTHGINVTTIFQATLALAKTRRCTAIHNSMENLVLLLQMIYTFKLAKQMNLKPNTLASTKAISRYCQSKKSLHWPDEQGLKDGLYWLNWNIQYWSNLEFR